MSPPRTTTAEKVAAGNPGKRALPAPIRPPIDADVPGPPKMLRGAGDQKARARELWEEYAPLCHELGLLTRLDVATLGRWCDFQSKYEACSAVVDEEGLLIETERGTWKHRPEASLMTTYGQRLEILGKKLGMSPADRQGMEAPAREDTTEELDPREAWLARSKGKR